ncbi:hypothetical protein C1H46_040069 [Malus baccata]|uniref:Hexosyltransferase n=1 Tax=Malus baccata TaxID=106549 RepID=A0A540KK62_MALBA|nr:hypothetical protein C1H46_040069 [Malus baccata]
MRRRAAEYRRPVRRRFSNWIWALFGLFSVAGLVLLVVNHNQHEDRVEQPVLRASECHWIFMVPQYCCQQSHMVLCPVLGDPFDQAMDELIGIVQCVDLKHLRRIMMNNLFIIFHIEPAIMERNTRLEQVAHESLNFTEEILSARSFSRQLAEQMTLAKAYVIIAKEHNNLHLAWELSSKIRSCQLLLSTAAMRGEPVTLEEAEPIIKSLSYLIFRAEDAHYDIATTIMTMKSHIQALEERANAATIQSTVFGQLAAEALPKSLHCLNVKLTADWLKKPYLQRLADEKRNSPRLVDNNTYHFCLFSDNVVATSVVVNSTVSNADHPKQLVFHIVTNGINYGTMQAWFQSNDFKGFAISNPIISAELDPQACGWAFGMNVVDLIAWKKANVTARYHYWQEQNANGTLWRLGTLPPGLLTFYGLTEPLDRRWHVLGLGYDLNIDNRLIESAAVVHFNGFMKPWLKLAIGRYKPLWERYVNQSHPYLQDCVTS